MKEWKPQRCDLDTRLSFGRHKGELVEDVLESDAAWLLWAVEEEKIEVDKALQDAITRAAR